MRKGFVIHWNGPPANCVGRTHDRCVQYWNAVRNFHMSPTPTRDAWSDIAYSFGVCPHGIRFTGRGWHKNQFANGSDVVPPNDGADSEWYTVLTFIGEGEHPTQPMIDNVKVLIHEGRQNQLCGQRVLPHNAFKIKTCPGPEFTALAKLWDNNADLVSVPVEENDLTPDESYKLNVIWQRTGEIQLSLYAHRAQEEGDAGLTDEDVDKIVDAIVAANLADAVVDKIKERL
jgi:hypothetical protein